MPTSTNDTSVRHATAGTPPYCPRPEVPKRSGRRAEEASPSDGVRVVGLLVRELFDLACQGTLPGALAGRRPECHVRQITMYLCHVVLSMNYGTIARALGRDRTTVVHGCKVVEDRRDDRVYDLFVERCERCVGAVFTLGEGEGDEC